MSTDCPGATPERNPTQRVALMTRKFMNHLSALGTDRWGSFNGSSGVTDRPPQGKRRISSPHEPEEPYRRPAQDLGLILGAQVRQVRQQSLPDGPVRRPSRLGPVAPAVNEPVRSVGVRQRTDDWGDVPVRVLVLGG